MPLTTEQIKAATCSTQRNAELFTSYINNACEHYGILSPAQQLVFLSQVGHESAGLFYTEELASGNDYEGRASLGNTQPGDGKRFKGRGLIQITGRANYQAVGDALGADFISTPTLLGGKNATVCTPEQLSNAAMSAAWFWNTKGLNDIALLIDIYNPLGAPEDSNMVYFKRITRVINGGYNGLDDRMARYESGRSLFAWRTEPRTERRNEV